MHNAQTEEMGSKMQMKWMKKGCAMGLGETELKAVCFHKFTKP